MKQPTSPLLINTQNTHKEFNHDSLSPLYSKNNTPTRHLSPDSLYSVSEWSVGQVTHWLKQCGFSKHVQSTFESHRIDGRVLLCLNEHDLRQAPLRMNILGDLKRMSIAIQQLRRKWKQQIQQHQLATTNNNNNNNNNDDGSGGNNMTLDNENDDDSDSNDRNDDYNSKQTKTNKSSKSHHSHSRNRDSLQSLLLLGEDNSIPETLGLLWEHYLPSLTIPSPEIEPWSSMLSKLFVSICFFFISIFVTSLTMVFVHERVPDPLTYPPLPDIILDNVPLIPWAFVASEVLAAILFVIMCGVMFVHKHRGVILRRMLAVIGTVFLLRCVTMFVTSLSVPGEHLGSGCKALPPLNTIDEKLQRAWLIASRFGLSITGLKTCGDYMFSGHSSCLTLLNLFIVEYTPRNYRGLHIMSWTMNLFGMAFVLAAHEHYSLDVFLAFYISSRMFGYYHQHANIQHALDDLDKDHKDSWFMYIPLFSFLEENMNGKLPNEYEWPWAPLLDSLRRKLRRNNRDENNKQK